jgi:hypothetical protein
MIARAAVHVHSDWSHDGKWPLSKLASLFKRMGCSVMMTSEHGESFDPDRWQQYREACLTAGSSTLLIVPGIEYSDPANVVHVLVWGSQIPFLGPVEDIGRLLNKVYAVQGITVLAHPSRKDAWKRVDSSWEPLLLGIEQWNRKVDGVAPSAEAAALLKQSCRMLPFVGLDFHRSNQLFPLTMRLQVGSVLREEDVMMALREKRASAEAFRISLEYFAGGTCGRVMTAAEHLRGLAKRMVGRDVKNPKRESTV